MFLAVGKLRPAYRAACDEYRRRLCRYVEVREAEVRQAGRAGSATAERREEARRLGAQLPDRAQLIVLARDGTGWTSAQLAGQLERWRLAARPVVFVLGGSQGLDPELLRSADARWSLGPLTLPHELARVVAYEQIYRAFTILRGEPYHKGK
ncbi:MAG: 23S rRNA (pseudouridine(1915)-N(3))-methyltransferase RlmH [Gemmatimonadales bacterium]